MLVLLYHFPTTTCDFLVFSISLASYLNQEDRHARVSHQTVQFGQLVEVFVVPLDEMVQEVLDPLLHLGLLQRDRIALVGDLNHQLAQLVQLALDLEEALGRQGEPERRETRLCDSSKNSHGKVSETMGAERKLTLNIDSR